MENKEKIEVKKVELPHYQLCEHMKDMQQVTVSIFRLNLEELIFEKMYILFEKLFVADNKLENRKIELQMATDKILLETDFKGLGLTNEKMRTAHIKTLTGELEDKVDECKTQVKNYETKLKILNDLISLRRLELKIETDLKEDD